MPQTSKQNSASMSRSVNPRVPKGSPGSALKVGPKKIGKLMKGEAAAFSIAVGARGKSLADIRAKLGISQPELSRLTGYSVRAIAGWEGGKPLSEPAKQKLQETSRLIQALTKIISAPLCGEWLRTANSAFEGQTPIQIIERGESDRIWRMIFQIDASVAD